VTSSKPAPGQASSGETLARAPTVVVMAVAVGAIFALDLATSLAYEIHFLYLLIVWCGVFWATPRQVAAFVAICCALTVISAIPYAEGVTWGEIANRAMTIVFMCLAAYFGLRQRREAQALRRFTADLHSTFEREELLRVTFNSAPDGINLVGLDGKFIGANAAYQQMVGYTEEELLRMTPENLTHEDDLSRNLAVRQELLDGKRESYEIEKRYHTKDGGLIWVRNTVSLIKDDRGKPRFTVAVVQDITESKRAEHELSAYAKRLQTLSRRLVEAQEAERRRIAGQLHDQVGQNLTALNINLDLIRQRASAESKAHIGDRIEDSMALIDTTVERVRNVIGDLRPAVLDDYGLIPALRWYADQTERRTGIRVAVSEHGSVPRLSSVAESALFRIVQEALTNSAKHGHATETSVGVRAERGWLTLEITDNGVGFNPDDEPRSGQRRGWGLTLMRERVEAVGGKIEIIAAPGRGVRIAIQVRT
jgi:two-component system, NarL family, sensor histidine kinase UhpB